MAGAEADQVPGARAHASAILAMFTWVSVVLVTVWLAVEAGPPHRLGTGEAASLRPELGSCTVTGPEAAGVLLPYRRVSSSDLGWGG